MKFYEIIKEVKVDKIILKDKFWDILILREQEYEDERRQRLRRSVYRDRKKSKCLGFKNLMKKKCFVESKVINVNKCC